MSIKVKTLLDEIAKRGLNGKSDFSEKGFTCYSGGKFSIYGVLDHSNPEFTTESVNVIYQGSLDKSDLAQRLRKRIAEDFSLEYEIGNFMATITEDREVSGRFKQLEDAEEEYNSKLDRLIQLVGS